MRAFPAGLRSLALDRPGYRANPLGPGTFAGNVTWLLGELDQAGIDEAVLVGHSYGGGVALAAAASAPERVRGLVLIASVGPGCVDGWDRLLAAPFVGPICAVAAWWLTPWLVRLSLAAVACRRDRPLEHHEHVLWDEWANARHENGAMWRTFLVEQRELVHRLDELDARLPQIATPTLVIADPADRIVPVATAYALSDQLPDARLRLISGGGHQLPRQIPDVIAAEIAQFAEQL